MKKILNLSLTIACFCLISSCQKPNQSDDIIVDDAIVVIENTHRIFVQGKGKLTATTSAKMAAGEVFIPVLAGTLTTLAPFFPLLLWKGIIGKFMPNHT